MWVMPDSAARLLRLLGATADVHLHRRLRGDRHQPWDDDQHAVGDLHHPGLGGLPVLRDDREQHGGAHQGLPHVGELAAEIGNRAA